MLFIYIMLGLVILAVCAIAGWVVIKNHESDELYKSEIDRIYGRK
jgi:hypothetical protein